MSVQKLLPWLHQLPKFAALATILAALSFTVTGCLADVVQGMFPASTPTPGAIGRLSTLITLAPDRGYAGTYVQVIGVGWPPGEEVLLVLNDENGRSSVLVSDSADQSGRLATGFLYPLNERWVRLGAHTVLAYTADGQFQSSAQFLVEVPEEDTPTPTATPFVTATPLSTFTATATRTNTPIPTPTATPTPTTPPTPSPIATVAPLVATPLPGPLMPATAAPVAAAGLPNWRGDYWNNPDLYGPPVLIRDDALIDFDWGLDSPSAPSTKIGVDNFSTRWSRLLDFTPGLYRFSIEVDDGARLFIDEQLVISDWRDAGPRTLTSELYLTGGSHRLRLDFYERRGRALIRFWWEKQAEFQDWRGSYFANANLQGQPVLIRDDAAIDFDWGAGSPNAGVPNDRFSVRWERRLAFLAGRYQFTVNADDGIRVWLDKNLVINQWPVSGSGPAVTEIYLTNGEYDLRVEYYENDRNAAVRFDWKRVAGP